MVRNSPLPSSIIFKRALFLGGGKFAAPSFLVLLHLAEENLLALDS